MQAINSKNFPEGYDRCEAGGGRGQAREAAGARGAGGEQAREQETGRGGGTGNGQQRERCNDANSRHVDLKKHTRMRTFEENSLIAHK